MHTGQRCASWTAVEDQLLLAGVTRYGSTAQWARIASTLFGNGRTGAACRRRWQQCVDPQRKQRATSRQQLVTMMHSQLQCWHVQHDDDVHHRHHHHHQRRLVRELVDAMLRGSSTHQQELALIQNCERGIGCSAELVEMVKSISVEDTSDAANAVFAMFLYFGFGVEEDYQKAFRLFEKGASRGHHFSLYRMAKCFETGNGVDVDFVKAASLYAKGIDHGNANAIYDLAVCFFDGAGVEKDLQEAARLYRVAMELGHVSATYNLALCYEKGDGVNQSIQEAMRLYRVCVDRSDHVKSICNLAICLESSDIEAAVELYRKGAALRSPNSMYSLARCYHYGLGVPTSMPIAILWLRRIIDVSNEGDKMYVMATGTLTEIFSSNADLRFPWDLWKPHWELYRCLQKDAKREMIMVMMMRNRCDNAISSLPWEVVYVVLFFLACQPRVDIDPLPKGLHSSISFPSRKSVF